MREMNMHHHDDQAVHTGPYGVMVPPASNSGNKRTYPIRKDTDDPDSNTNEGKDHDHSGYSGVREEEGTLGTPAAAPPTPHTTRLTHIKLTLQTNSRDKK
ncbi:hypothetical protein Pcinc_001845 [Petrolisthes cinctipes]|uniref:Uncharacterized protein n=1 Tax=Petrolisthes cinctipes TaxID=88211 RepID=A0AAE1L5R8_PETCI|nr:hypothetical protein Pcinc_001845 [Petrolisthes cinctipes]